MQQRCARRSLRLGPPRIASCTRDSAGPCGQVWACMSITTAESVQLSGMRMLQLMVVYMLSISLDGKLQHLPVVVRYSLLIF